MPERIECAFGHFGGRHVWRGARAGQSFLGGLTFTELAKRVWSETSEDEATGREAELAFYFLRAFFPLLIFLISIMGLMPSAQDGLVDYLMKATPRYVGSQDSQAAME